MKKKWKKLFAVTAAAAMSCTMLTGFANTAAITKVEVKSDGAEPVEYTGEAINGIKVNPSQQVTVTVRLAGDGDEAAALADAEATFLSYLNAAENDENGQQYTNDTIQYIDQKATGNDGTVSFTFRPRTNLGANKDGIGEFTAKAGGVDVATPAAINYSVEEAKIPLTLTAGTEGADATIELGSENDTAAYKLSVPVGKELPAADKITVKLNNITLANTAEITYYTYDVATGVITINASALTSAGIDAAGPYNVVVSAENYVDSAAATLNVTDKPSEVPENKVDDVQKALNDISVNTNPTVDSNGATVELEKKVTVSGDDYSIAYDISYDNTVVEVNGTTITYTPNENSKFAERVTVNATVGGAANKIAKTYDIYFVKPGKTISFGNVTAIADEAGEDAFAIGKVLPAASDANILEARAKALNIALDRAGLDTIAKAEDTLDYDQDHNIALAEYRIYKLMIEHDPMYTPELIQQERAKWLEAHKQ